MGIWLSALIGATMCLGSNASAQPNSAQNAAIALDHGWQFRQVAPAQNAESDWLPAKVPGDVHLDLLANKKIPDPFYRDNEAKLQWIENESWEYLLNFDATPALLAHSNVDLVFDGLDAAANVYLNGVRCS
jgi:beta-mannosidase